MGVRWGGRGDMRRSDLWTAGLAGALIGGVAGGLMMWAQDDDPAPARDAQIEAAVVVNAAVVEMRGYGPDGKPGVFLYDCKKAEGEIVEGEPTLICTQRKE